MKGKPFVIGLIIFVIIVVGLVTWAMMSTINEMKKEQEEVAVVISTDVETTTVFLPHRLR